MRTLIVSDLHLGSRAGNDLLRRPELRTTLLQELSEVDRLVLLGDVLELRHGPAREALEVAREFFADLGRTFAGREVVVVPGNHDHALIEPWLAQRAEEEQPPPLGVEQRLSGEQASPALATLAQWAAPAELTVAYPGLWVRPDVYATHGHYLDFHLTVPALERIGLGAMSRLMRRPVSDFAGVDDYEAVSRPLFAWLDALAQQAIARGALDGQLNIRAWGALRRRRGRRRIRRRLIRVAFPLGVAALNRAGLGPLRANLSTDELRRSGLRGIGEVLDRCGLIASHVIFGHTHRAGPLPADAQGEWRAPSGARLVNAGCWTFDESFVREGPADSPYWPGGSVLVEEEGEPRQRRLLDDRTKAELGGPSAPSVPGGARR